MDARALAATRMVLGSVALAACFSPARGWPIAAAVVGALASLALAVGWRPRIAALIAFAALTLAAPSHSLLLLALLFGAATDAGARASVDVVLRPSSARARVPGGPIALAIVAVLVGAVVLAWRHRLTAIDLAAALAWLPLLAPRAAFDALARAVGSRTAPIDVIYDGKCSFCRSSVDTLLAVDSLELLRPRDSHAAETRAAHPTLDPERAQREMLVFDGARLEGGFDAFRLMAWKLPAAWLLLPFLYLPPVPQLGRVVYRIIAANRTKIACELNLAPPSRPPLETGPRTVGRLATVLLLVAVAALEVLLALRWL
jgi:predicted DCC family thiol-disulfide oxidoreductase YuxK